MTEFNESNWNNITLYTPILIQDNNIYVRKNENRYRHHLVCYLITFPMRHILHTVK